jgi:hypothetical protein
MCRFHLNSLQGRMSAITDDSEVQWPLSAFSSYQSFMKIGPFVQNVWEVRTWQTKRLVRFSRQNEHLQGLDAMQYGTQVPNETELQPKGQLLLGAFARFRKATISFVKPVRLSVRTEQPGCQWTDFDKTWYFRFFRKSVEKNSSFIKIPQE